MYRTCPCQSPKIGSESLKAISVWGEYCAAKRKKLIWLSAPMLNTHIPSTISTKQKKLGLNISVPKPRKCPQHVCSPYYYCPTPELQFKLKCSSHCKGLDSSVKSVQHLENMVLLHKKDCWLTVHYFSAATLYRSIVSNSWHPGFFSVFLFPKGYIQVNPTSPTVCLKSCPSANGGEHRPT